MKNIYYILTILSINLHICTMEQQISNKTKLMELASAYILSRAIHVAACIKIADHIIDKPQNIIDLAKKTNTHEESLYRLLRLLSSYNIFYENENNTFSHTPMSQCLISTDPKSLWNWVVYHNDSNRWLSFGEMEHAICTGQPSFNHIFGKGYFDFIAESPNLSEQFDKGMHNIAEEENACIVNSYNFSPYKLIADIGGGTGGLLNTIIKKYNAHGILFDLPHVQHSAQIYTNKNNNNDRITFIPSTGFFNPVPNDADLYILKRILHDWEDQDCMTILVNCYNAMNDESRLLIIDTLIPETNIRTFNKDIDIAMMVLFGGKERTQKELITLLEKAQLELVAIYNTTSYLSIIEVKKLTRITT